MVRRERVGVLPVEAAVGAAVCGRLANATVRSYYRGMCRNITTLRGLEPLATSQEIEAAARQYVRKISGVQKTSPATEAAFERAVLTITQASTQLLRELPPRKQPPPTLPPLRRIALAKAATINSCV